MFLWFFDKDWINSKEKIHIGWIVKCKRWKFNAADIPTEFICAYRLITTYFTSDIWHTAFINLLLCVFLSILFECFCFPYCTSHNISSNWFHLDDCKIAKPKHNSEYTDGHGDGLWKCMWFSCTPNHLELDAFGVYTCVCICVYVFLCMHMDASVNSSATTRQLDGIFLLLFLFSFFAERSIKLHVRNCTCVLAEMVRPWSVCDNKKSTTVWGSKK